MRLSLEKTWTECLRMWKWIAKEKKKDRKLIISELKTIWLTKNHYKPNSILKDCFFCNRAPGDCTICPGKEIDPFFNCKNDDYCYFSNPLAFYAKLVSLNKIRLARKRKAKR
jgi:hypothetical protein